MNIILTGHKGLIGSSLKDRLEKKGHKVTKSFDKRDGSDLRLLSSYKPSEHINLFIHAAAHCKINGSIKNPRKDFKNNVVATHEVFEFCRERNIPKIVYFSSSRVLSPERNPYTASKLFGEELCKAYNKCYGLEYVIIRPSTVYGPFWDETERLTHKFITNALTGEDLEIYGNPETKTLDFTYIDDFIEATMISITQRNEDFDISGDQETNVYKLAQFIIDYTGSSSKIRVCSPEKEQPQKVRLDISKLRSLGYKPKVSIEEGMVKTIDWYKEYLS